MSQHGHDGTRACDVIGCKKQIFFYKNDGSYLGFCRSHAPNELKEQKFCSFPSCTSQFRYDGKWCAKHAPQDHAQLITDRKKDAARKKKARAGGK